LSSINIQTPTKGQKVTPAAAVAVTRALRPGL
jgi:hypothetical protein